MADGPVTRNEWVEQELREAILSGDLEPGERLLTAALAERFSVSPTPLREALHRLTGEGLVDFAPQRGARVAPLSEAACIELREIRILLDPAAAASSIEHADDTWGAAVQNASAHLTDAWAATPLKPADSEKAYRSFYGELLRCCPSSRMLRLSRIVRDEEARYRIIALEHMDHAMRQTLHDSIVNAALAYDSETMYDAIVAEVDAYTEQFMSLGADETSHVS